LVTGWRKEKKKKRKKEECNKIIKKLKKF